MHCRFTMCVVPGAGCTSCAAQCRGCMLLHAVPQAAFLLRALAAHMAAHTWLFMLHVVLDALLRSRRSPVQKRACVRAC
eukprot:13671055-Alexandrium_andersonii.AAC.1